MYQSILPCDESLPCFAERESRQLRDKERKSAKSDWKNGIVY
jgi:hypothetical protein